jgi:CENP-B N-terminal DNA-binding domain/Tc5 transposase DNA-binding domain
VDEKPETSFQETSEMYIINEAIEDEQYLLEAQPTEETSPCEQEYEYFFEEEPSEEAQKSPESKKIEAEQADSKNVLNRKSYTVTDKLKIIAYAEENNNRQAARHFNMNESSVRCFRRQKDLLLKMCPQKKTNRRALPHWPNLEQELKQFVLNHPIKHGTKAKLKDIRKEAILIAEKHGIAGFNGSNSYIFKFMQRHSLPSASPRPRKHKNCTN